MQYIALFRGINVGGKNRLPMKDLVAILEGIGCAAVRTYGQSGNTVFEHESAGSAGLIRQIQDAIARSTGIDLAVLLLESIDFLKAMADNPFPEAVDDPKSLHLGFLAEIPKHPDMDGLEALRQSSERYQLVDDVFYLHAPEGVGRSKLAASAEKLLGVPMTDRNWRTVSKIREMLD